MSGLATPSVRVLERGETFTALGLRFWDAALDAQVRDGLIVTARPAIAARTQVRRARLTQSGVYAFHALPGLVEIEHGFGDLAGSPAFSRRYVVEVADAERRFAEMAFQVTLPLPYRGLFLVGDATGSPAEAPPGVLLYSAATRRRPTWFGAVRGELADAATGAPRGHALLEATDPQGDVWHGVADAEGRFAIWLPYPSIEATPAGSPSEAPGLPVSGREWTVGLRAFHSPGDWRALPGTAIPDYQSVFEQTPVELWDAPPDAGGSAAAEWTGVLRFGRETTARSGESSKLLAGPETTSP